MRKLIFPSALAFEAKWTIVLLALLFFIFPPVVYAQISVDSVESDLAKIIPDEATAQFEKKLRSDILSDPTTLTKFILPKIHPMEREKIELENGVLNIVSWAPVAIGCGETGDIFGYYSPLDNLWVLVELDKQKKIADAALAKGFPISEKQSGWWPNLINEADGVLKAIQADTVIQMALFTAQFGGGNCVALSDAKHISHAAAVEQLKMLQHDVPKPDNDRAQLFIKDLEKETKSNLSDWEMRFRLPVSGDDWFVVFTSQKYVGILLIAHWRVNKEEGNAYFQNSTLLPLLIKNGN